MMAELSGRSARRSGTPMWIDAVRERGDRRPRVAGFGAVLAFLGSLTLLAAPMPATGAAGAPPVLPQVDKGCVGQSPAVVTDPPWALRRVAPQRVWPLTQGAGQLVAVVDSGVSRQASGLTGAVRRGADVVTKGSGDRDCAGRGTALAGIVAARPVQGSGFSGVAPAADVFPVRISDAENRVTASAVAAGIREAVRARARVILVGVGVPEPDSDLRAAVGEAVARDAVVVAPISDRSASDAGGLGGSPWYPAGFPEVLAVGGVGTDGVPTESTSARANVDLLGPSVGAVSVASSGQGHWSVGGPAVAAAYVAGAAVLLRAYHPELGQGAVRRRLELAAEHPLGQWPVAGVGFGTLDLYRAVAGLQLDEKPLPPTPAQPVDLPAEPPADPAKWAAGLVASGVAGSVAIAYVSTIAMRSGRRRRWRA
ncbi:S8 family serine peptidase [Micromonospora lupini]|uniref:S8 family serine peptidase n=1 Tax=Micromonospora lupini TaxID=285679 RepID=UPI0033EECAD7